MGMDKNLIKYGDNIKVADYRKEYAMTVESRERGLLELNNIEGEDSKKRNTP